MKVLFSSFPAVRSSTLMTKRNGVSNARTFYDYNSRRRRRRRFIPAGATMYPSPFRDGVLNEECLGGRWTSTTLRPRQFPLMPPLVVETERATRFCRRDVFHWKRVYRRSAACPIRKSAPGNTGKKHFKHLPCAWRCFAKNGLASTLALSDSTVRRILHEDHYLNPFKTIVIRRLSRQQYWRIRLRAWLIQTLLSRRTRFVWWRGAFLRFCGRPEYALSE